MTSSEHIPKKQKIESTEHVTQPKRKQLLINFFENSSSSIHWSGQWKHPQDRSHTYKDLDYWLHLVKLAEKAKANIFIADSLALFDVWGKGDKESNFKGPLHYGIQAPKNEPSAPVAAMAAVSKNVGFTVTVSTISEHPYHLARRLATLDHLTKGRISWNIVSSFLPSTGKQVLNGAPLPEHDSRYTKSEEYLKVIYKLLLSSWRDDAVVLDKERGVFVDTDRVREINHVGEHFNVVGPSLSEPSNQRLPVLVQAGASTKGRQFAAQHAEVVYVSALTAEALGKKIKEFKDLAETYGRGRNDIKYVASATVISGKTEEEALEKYEEIKKHADTVGAQVLFGGWTGIDLSQWEDDQELEHVENNGMKTYIENLTKFNPGKKFTKKSISEKISLGGSISALFVGTGSQIADQIEEYVDKSDVDGFNFTYAVWPQSFEDVVDYVIPELQERGLSQKEWPVEGGTFRENLNGKKGQTFVPKTHPAYNYRWSNDLTKEEFETKLENLNIK
ncbi:hypothetical protein WICMUC_004242 [Wickerhamomyces mucosus]|uniref:Luciferase-like domain-containing protein n=1 Tax=Wickerhamomyces mucosus TaxID=1378264 RepID=A0A9P8TAY6_9ASCO|nr:hypothetical protein WICMUC_004242 [Wickerhamomyces mucosus]